MYFLHFSVRNAEFIFNLKLQTKVYFIIKLKEFGPLHAELGASVTVTASVK